MNAEPSQITVDHSQRLLTIAWKDGHVSALPFNLLRKECPCASCAEERKNTSPLRLVAGPIITQAGIQKVEPVGRYALNLTFDDRHDTGIYTYEYLRGLCRCPECAGGAGKPSGPA